MATTAIFAEILIIGLQATVWLAVALATILGASRVDLGALKGWEGLATLFVLTVAYTLGIVVDRVADSVFNRFDKRLRRRIAPRSLPSVARMRLYVMAENAGMAKFLDYVRSRVRVARATAFNFMLITVAVVVLCIVRPAVVGRNGWLTALAAALGVAGVALATFAWARITKTYYRRLLQAYEIVRENSSDTAPASDTRR